MARGPPARGPILLPHVLSELTRRPASPTAIAPRRCRHHRRPADRHRTAAATDTSERVGHPVEDPPLKEQRLVAGQVERGGVEQFGRLRWQAGMPDLATGRQPVDVVPSASGRCGGCRATPRSRTVCPRTVGCPTRRARARRWRRRELPELHPYVVAAIGGAVCLGLVGAFLDPAGSRIASTLLSAVGGAILGWRLAMLTDD
jgi:hypothetical protein